MHVTRQGSRPTTFILTPPACLASHPSIRSPWSPFLFFKLQLFLEPLCNDGGSYLDREERGASGLNCRGCRYVMLFVCLSTISASVSINGAMVLHNDAYRQRFCEIA
jgi:hypothetical protein